MKNKNLRIFIALLLLLINEFDLHPMYSSAMKSEGYNLEQEKTDDLEVSIPETASVSKYDLDELDFPDKSEYIEYCLENDIPIKADESVENINNSAIRQSNNISTSKHITISNLAQENKCIQNFTYNYQNPYIYVTKQANNNVYIYRCMYLNDENYVKIDRMVIEGAGHGTSLELYEYNNKEYLLMSVTGAHDEESDIYRPIEIGRVEYQPGATISNSSVKRFTDLFYARYKYNESDFTTAELNNTIRNVYVSLNNSKSYICIWVRLKNGEEWTSMYNFSTFNQILDNANTPSFKGNTAMRNSLLIAEHLTNIRSGGIQGLETNISSNNYKAMFANNTQNTISLQIFDITKLHNSLGNYLLTRNYSVSSPYSNSSYIELEGVKQVSLDGIYFGIAPDYKAGNCSTAYIYSSGMSFC